MKKVLKILTLVMLIFTILKIGDTYAKYFAEANTETLSQDIAKWVILVNELDISENAETLTFPIDKFSNFSNENSVADKISPSSEGYADIVIDPTGTDVAVRYDIELELTGTSDLAIEAGLEMASGENTLVKTGENTYTGIISLADVQAGNKANIKACIKWTNDEEKNGADTEIATTGERVKFQVEAKVTVTQYLGEAITEYVEPETP